MKTFIYTVALVSSSLFIASCVQGKYTSEIPMSGSSATSCNSIAPMHLKSTGKVKWKRYAYTNSYANPYVEHAKWKKKGDTIYMRKSIYNGDEKLETKTFLPQFVIQGDTLISLSSDCGSYVKKRGRK